MAGVHVAKGGHLVETPAEKALFSKVNWHILPMLLVAYVFAYIDRVNVGFAQLQMKSELHLSDAVFALGAGLFFVGYFLFEVPSNMALEKIGARKTLLRIMVCWGLCATAMAYVTSPWQFYVLRFLLGAFEAGFFPGCILYFTYWYPSARRGRVISIFMTATVLAGILVGPFNGAVMKFGHGFLGQHGWQWMFIANGLPCLVGAPATLAIPHKVGQTTNGGGHKPHGKKPPHGSSVSRLVFGGSTGYVSPRGVAALLFGCFGQLRCEAKLRVSVGSASIGSRRSFVEWGGEGGIIRFPLTHHGQVLLARARNHHLRVTVVATRRGQRLSEVMTLVKLSSKIPAVHRSRSGVSVLRAFGHTGFVSPRGIARVFVGCFAQRTCAAAVKLTAGRSGVGSARSVRVSAQHGALVNIKLSHGARTTLAARGKLVVQLTISGPHGQRQTSSLLLVPFAKPKKRALARLK